MSYAKESSVKGLCVLYILLDRKLQHRAPKLNRQDKKKLAKQLTIYKFDFFADNLVMWAILRI